VAGISTRRDEPLWGPLELSEYLGVPLGTIYNWRYRGGGPPAVKIGRHVRYVPATVRKWVAERTVVDGRTA